MLYALTLLTVTPPRRGDAVQRKAEEIVQYYCVSDIGLTTYSQGVSKSYGFREGKEDVETLFATEFLQRHADPGLARPMAPMAAKIEVRTSRQLHWHQRSGVSKQRRGVLRTCGGILEMHELWENNMLARAGREEQDRAGSVRRGQGAADGAGVGAAVHRK